MLCGDMYLKQYQHNKRFASHGMRNCDGFDFRDWSVTVYFYAILHLVQYVLINECDETPDDHKKRKECMYAHNKIFHRDIMRDYNSLQMLSQLSRYTHGANIDNKDVNKAFECMENLESALKAYIKNATTSPV